MTYRFLLLAGTLAALGIQTAAAQSAEVFGGFNVVRTNPENGSSSTLTGWSSSVTGYATNRLGFTGEISGFYNQNPVNTAQSPSTDVHQYSIMGGPQFRLIKRDRFETSFKALVGGAHRYVPDGNFGENSVAAQFGSNFDVNLSRKLAIRVSPGVYLTNFDSTGVQRDFRVAIGPVFRFGGRE